MNYSILVNTGEQLSSQLPINERFSGRKKCDKKKCLHNI